MIILIVIVVILSLDQKGSVMCGNCVEKKEGRFLMSYGGYFSRRS